MNRTSTIWLVPLRSQELGFGCHANALVLLASLAFTFSALANEAKLRGASDDVVQAAAQNVVKIYGPGGLGRIEDYGTGVLVSANGFILTSLTPILDVEEIRIVLGDGRRLTAKLHTIDTQREVALLKAAIDGAPFFDLKQTAVAKPGQRVLALSNQFNIAAGDEPATVQLGAVSTVAPLPFRRGRELVTTAGNVYVLDMNSNNEGSAGGALVDLHGRLLGLIGKEVRAQHTGTWVNHALPISDLQEFVASAIARGDAPQVMNRVPAESKAAKPAKGSIDLRGMIFVPDVLDRTSSYLDGVVPGSPAARAGLLPDDLVLFVGETMVHSIADVKTALATIKPGSPLKLVILRDQSMKTIDVP